MADLMWRIDYAASGHPQWLYRLDDSFDVPMDAVKRAQQRMDEWPAMTGFRIVRLDHPVLELVDESHVGKIIDEDGKRLIP